MIYSSFRADDNLEKYPKAVRTALEYLRSKDFTTVEAGTYPIQGKDIYALVQEITTCPIEQKRAEIHKQYLDIQYLFTGEEKYGVAPNVGQDIITEAKEQNDIYFFDSVKEETFITLKSGDYLVLFPEDIHRPGLMTDEPMQIKKVVIKVNMDLIESGFK